MACDLTLGRKESCLDSVAGIKEVYFVNYGDMGSVTLTSDEVTNMTGDGSNNLTAFKYELKGNNSFETTVNSSRENGTTFFEQTLNITLKKLSKEDHKELKLLIYGRPHVFVRDYNDNVFLMGREHGCDVSAGTFSTGNALGDFNGYNLTLGAMEVLPSNFVDVNADAATAGFPFSEMAGLSGTITITEGTNS
jgi:hypothetical protein